MHTGIEGFGENFTLSGNRIFLLRTDYALSDMGFTLKHTSLLSNNKGREM